MVFFKEDLISMENCTLLSLYKESLKFSVPKNKLLTVINSHLEAADYDMAALDAKSSRAAACLLDCGCHKGDKVLISSHETIHVWSFFFGALKLGAVPFVLFPEIGMGGLEVRLKASDARFLITDADPEKLRDSIHFPETLCRIILLEKRSDASVFYSYHEEDWDPITEFAEVEPDDDAFIVFTSGTTGTPKPVVHRHGIAGSIVRSMTDVLHASAADIYWCTAHPAWITGTVYGILGPILCGIHSIQYEGKFHAKRWIPILQDQKVSLWYTAPTALRGLMRENANFFAGYDFSALKQIYSIGEPLSSQLFEWGQQTFNSPIYDTWFQTECGTIRIANQPGQKIIPGWMGKVVSDCEAKITSPNADGIGKLTLQAGFSSMFKEYYNMPDETLQKIEGDAYHTGDLASINTEGYFHFEGRADDVINTSGHLVGPLEVEQVLMAHPAVELAAVVAEPDELCYEVPAAYIVLAEGQEWSRQLETALKVAVNTGVSPYAVPKHFYPVNSLPQTESGKINRKALIRR